MSGRKRAEGEEDVEDALPVRSPSPLLDASQSATGVTSAAELPSASTETDGAGGPIIVRKGRGLKGKDDKAKLEPSFVPRGAFFLHDDRFAAAETQNQAEGGAPKPAVPSRGRGKKLWDPFEEAGNRWAHDKFDAHQRKEEDKPPVTALKAEVKLPHPAHKSSPQKASKAAEPATITPSKHQRAQGASSPLKDTQAWGDIASSPAKPAKVVPDAKHSDPSFVKPLHPVKEGARRTPETRVAPEHRPSPDGRHHGHIARDTAPAPAKQAHHDRGKHGHAAAPVAAAPALGPTPVASSVSAPAPATTTLSFAPGKVHPADVLPTPPVSSELSMMGTYSRVDVPSMFSPMAPQAQDLMSQYGPGAVVTPGGLVVYPSAVGGIAHNSGGVTLMQSPTGEFIPAPMLPFFPQMPMQMFPPTITPEALMHAANMAGMQFQSPYQPELHAMQQHASGDASHTGTNIHAAEFVPASHRR